MKKSFLISIIGVLLAVSVLLSCGSCKRGRKKGPETDTTSNTFVDDQLPSDLNYGGAEIKILNWISEVVEFGCDQEIGSLINDACYRRDRHVEDRLGVTLNYREEPGGSNQGQVEKFCSLVYNVSASGSSEDYFDIIAAYIRAGATLSHQGYLANLLNIQNSYMRFDNPWWPSGLLDELAVGDALYITTGDLSPTVVQMAQGLWYNVDITSTYHLTDPYEHVKNDTWTLETFSQYVRDMANMTDGIYSVATTYWNIAELFHGCGISLAVRGDDGYPTMNPNLYGDKAVEIMSLFGQYTADEYFLVTDYSNAPGTGNDKYSLASYDVFAEGKALFLTADIGAGERLISTMDQKYGIIPAPKYDENQDRYYSTSRNSLSSFSIMRGQSQAEMTKISAVLECWASEGYRNVIPAVYDVCLTGRYIQSAESREMINLISDTVIYDFGRLYSAKETNYLCDRLGRIIQQKPGRSEYGKTWSSFGASEGPSTATSFERIIMNLRNLANQ